MLSEQAKIAEKFTGRGELGEFDESWETM